MTDSAKKRLAIDLEEIERQLRQTIPQNQPSSYAPSPGIAQPGFAQTKNDPLAELARIVGQDDPFRQILSADRAGVAPRRADPEMDDIFAFDRPRQPDPYAPDPYAQDDGRAQARVGRDDGHDDRHDDRYADDDGYGRAPDLDDVYGRDGYGRDGYAHPQAPQGHVDDPYAERGQAPQNDAAPGYAPQGYDERAYGRPAHQDGGYEDPRYAQPAYDPSAYDPRGYEEVAAPAARASHVDHDPRFAQRQAYAPRSGRQDGYADEQGYDEFADDGYYATEEPPARAPERRGRKRLVLVGAVLGVAVVGAAAAFIAGGDGLNTGEPPLITADGGPLKVEPQNPGGVEIPDQDRQIFERTGDEETRVVDREEQPVDVAAIARQSPRVVLPPPASSQQSREGDPIAQALAGAIAPSDELQASPAVSAAVAELGEPRRVRTVTVRPDGTIIRNDGAAFTQAPTASGEPAPTTDGGQTAFVPSAPWRAPALPQIAQGGTAPSEPAAQPAPVQVAAAPAQVAPAVPAPPVPAPAPQASAPLALTGSAPLPPVAAPQQTASVNAAPTTVGGGYAVQLGIRDTEARAQQAFTQFRDRYASLIGGASPIIMRAEVNGSTVYRVRVGPYALGDANSVCERIKGAGGDCFVARN